MCLPMPPSWFSLNNSLNILLLVPLLGSTELDQVNLTLLGPIESGPLIKNLEPMETISSHDIQSLSCFLVFERGKHRIPLTFSGLICCPFLHMRWKM